METVLTVCCECKRVTHQGVVCDACWLDAVEPEDVVVEVHIWVEKEARWAGVQLSEV